MIKVKKHVWQKDDNGNIDEFAVDSGFHNGPRCIICHDEFCTHCEPSWENTGCYREHFECKECHAVVDENAKYCYECGRKLNNF